MVRAHDIERLRDSIREAKGMLILHAQNAYDNHHWSRTVCESRREDWLDIIELALMAATLRDQALKHEQQKNPEPRK